MGSYLLMMAVTLLWRGLYGIYEWRIWLKKERLKPVEEQRELTAEDRKRIGFNIFCTIIGLGVLIWAFLQRGEAALSAAAANQLYLYLGALLVGLGLTRLVGPKVIRNRGLALVYLLLGLLLIAIGLGLIVFGFAWPVLKVFIFG